MCFIIVVTQGASACSSLVNLVQPKERKLFLKHVAKICLKMYWKEITASKSIHKGAQTKRPTDKTSHGTYCNVLQTNRHTTKLPTGQNIQQANLPTGQNVRQTKYFFCGMFCSLQDISAQDVFDFYLCVHPYSR